MYIYFLGLILVVFDGWSCYRDRREVFGSQGTEWNVQSVEYDTMGGCLGIGRNRAGVINDSSNDISRPNSGTNKLYFRWINYKILPGQRVKCLEMILTDITLLITSYS